MPSVLIHKHILVLELKSYFKPFKGNYSCIAYIIILSSKHINLPFKLDIT